MSVSYRRATLSVRLCSRPQSVYTRMWLSCISALRPICRKFLLLDYTLAHNSSCEPDLYLDALVEHCGPQSSRWHSGIPEMAALSLWLDAPALLCGLSPLFLMIRILPACILYIVGLVPVP